MKKTVTGFYNGYSCGSWFFKKKKGKTTDWDGIRIDSDMIKLHGLLKKNDKVKITIEAVK